MVIKFDRPVGAHLDMQELEYISALHQTGAHLRPDGSLVAADIVAFLVSRHGIATEEDGDYIQNQVLVDLAGDPEEDPKHVLDLRQVVALLTLPHLVKVSAKDDVADTDKYFGQVWGSILKDMGYGETEKPTLNVELVRAILETYGEFNVPQKVIEGMVEAAGGEGQPFNMDAFRSALVADTHLYDIRWESTESTYWEDVFRLDEKMMLTKTKSQRMNDVHASYAEEFASRHSLDEEMPDMDEGVKDKARRVWTMGAIDQTADTFRSTAFIILLWLAGIMVFFLYLYNTEAPWQKLTKDMFDSTVAYAVATGVSTWCWIFIQLSILGTLFFLLSTLGMSIYDKRGVWPTGVKLFIAMFWIGFTMIGGAISSINSKFFDTSTVSSESNSAGLWVVILVGVILLLMQLGVLILAVSPVSVLDKFQRLNKWLTPSLYRKEGNSKRAAGFKTEQMLDSALEMHESEVAIGKSMRASAHAMRAQGNAMTNFQENSHMSEYVGGVWWTWKKFFNSSICKQDGVWFHTRLLTCSVAQFIVMFGMLGLIVFGHGQINQKIVNAPPKELSISAQLDDKIGTIPWAALTPKEYFNEASATIKTNGTGFIPLRRISFVNVREFGALNVGFLLLESNTTDLDPRGEDGAWYFNLTGFYFFSNDTTSDKMIDGLTEYEYSEDYPSILEEELKRFGLNIPNTVDQAHFTSTLSLNPPFVTNWTMAHVYTNGLISQFDAITKALARGINSTEIIAYMQQLIVSSEEPSLLEDLANSVEAPEAYAGLYIGGLTAFASCALVFSLFIPSFVSTVLMFRSGTIPSLRSERTFKVYRTSGDTVTLLFGMTLWGAVFSGVIPGLLVGGLIFLMVWEETSEVFLLIIGQLFGILVTLIFKILILLYVRRLLVSAFYRRQPGASNILYLVLEVWNVALGLGAMFGRVAKLFLIVAVSLGRLESPILAEKVGWLFCINLDGIANTFRRDVLAHEAHRHPYIERLGLLYLLKLRFGQKFGTRAGGLWRLVYVSALMPWIRKYRASVRDVPDLEQLLLMNVPQESDDDDDALQDEVSKKEVQAKKERMLRLKSNRKLSMMQLEDGVDANSRTREGVLEEELRVLQDQNQKLKETNTELLVATKK